MGGECDMHIVYVDLNAEYHTHVMVCCGSIGGSCDCTLVFSRIDDCRPPVPATATATVVGHSRQPDAMSFYGQIVCDVRVDNTCPFDFLFCPSRVAAIV